MKGYAIVSGGMDSVTLAYMLKNGHSHDLTLVSFDYGQRHRKELDCAKKIAELLDCPHHVLDISGLRPLLKGSALTDSVDVPHGHYAEESMRLTVVPNRNAIMLAIAWGVASADGAEFLACGVHAGDHYIYPDCRPEFIDQLARALRTGTEGHRHPDMRLLAPFLHQSKADIARIGREVGVPYEHTWTCYEGQEISCGKCGSCTERLEAFKLAGGVDPLPYRHVVETGTASNASSDGA